MRANNVSPINTSTFPTESRATDGAVELAGHFFAVQLQGVITDLQTRVANLEREQAAEQQTVAFSELRPSWTVKQLAADLSMNEQTIRNFLALPDGHPQKLYSFQANPGGAHHLLPEHVADWLRRSRRQSA